MEKEAPKEEKAGPIPAANSAPNQEDQQPSVEPVAENKEQENPQEPQPTQEEYDLTNEELEVIQSTLFDLQRSATPRQIRIFTFRYMMAIRLFRTTSYFESLHFEKGIFNIEENRLLAYMILEYGLMKSVHELMDLKRDLLQVTEENINIKTMGKTFTRSKNYLRQLFEVLEMVIAY